jgi:protein O-mannosyl-transferase
MNQTPTTPYTACMNQRSWWLLLAAFALTVIVYWPGLSGGFLFDDYPNIVDNKGVQPSDASLPSLIGAALSSPSSEFKRPLASLSFAANYLITGLAPYWMKLTNLVIHLLNGLLVLLLARMLLRSHPLGAASTAALLANPLKSAAVEGAPANTASIVAALVAACWMLLPINLTGVLYVVQRMESMANLFVLLGLLGYVAGRQHMLNTTPAARDDDIDSPAASLSSSLRGFALCVASIVGCTGVGILAKETATMLPLYAVLVEWFIFLFRATAGRRDRRLISLFIVFLLLPMIVGLAWLLPGIFNPKAWATRDFTMGTRLISEARIIVDYIVWTVLPTPSALSFYHDDFRVSQGLLAPWTTLASMVLLGTLVALMIWLRKRQPVAALGIGLFLSCQLLTGTILPLELIYEHRNYFASFGLLLTIVPFLAAPAKSAVAGLPMALPRHALLAGLMLCWTTLTALTAYAWGNPLRLAEDLAGRAPQSPRAQYELGRTYVIYSHYDPASPFTQLAYGPLEKAAALPEASILPEQALIFMNSRMHLPLKDAWWNSMVTKLKAHKPGVQDESSLGALTQCARERHCELPANRMIEVFTTALAHPDPSARLLASYGDYAWNVLDDHELGERMTKEAVETSPGEPAYKITLIRMLVVQGRIANAQKALAELQTLNVGGRLNQSLDELRELPGLR